jgi:hypothetical protein
MNADIDNVTLRRIGKLKDRKGTGDGKVGYFVLFTKQKSYG